MNNDIFSRSLLVLGDSGFDNLQTRKVILFGVGGVGSWVAEALVRTGLKHITIVDCDNVSVSNINRQLMATSKTVGQLKVEAMRNHLLDINPEACITAVNQVFTDLNADDFHLDDYDVIIDCIDSLKDKAALILRACNTKAFFISSMGAALKMDSSKICVDEFWKVHGCPLARAIRGKFKHAKTFPSRKFLCVYSPEVLENKFKAEPDNDSPIVKVQTNGSLVHITGIFGFTIAGRVIGELSKLS